MPYVPGFVNDIFISFSHVDDTRDWVKEFHNQLNDRLAQLGVEVTIWRDTKLSRTDIFSDEIYTQLQQSALLISIISPPGINSHWCEDERQAFERFAGLNGGFRFGNHLRAIKVVKYPLPEDQHHDLFGVIGFEFYKREAHSRYVDDFHQSSPEFDKAINKLAQDIRSLLDALKSHVRASPKETVYVATTAPELRSNRDKIVQQLKDWGYAVIPQDVEPLRRLESFEAVAKAELAASIFSVHLVSDQPKSLFEEEYDLIAGQYELAQSLRKDRFVWVEPGRKLYSNFDDVIKRGVQNGLEVLKDRAIEDLKEVIRDKLDQKSNYPSRTGKSEAGLVNARTQHCAQGLQRSRRAVAVSKIDNPFPGLRSFKREQSHLFFGRDEQIRDVLERLDRTRFLPMVGVSGSGKSSLVHAGVIPALANNHVDAEAPRWRITMLRPGHNPMYELATEMCREFSIPEVDPVLNTLRGSSAGLARIVGQHLGAGERLLVLVDQFEELFRYHEEVDSRGGTDENVAFVKLLLAATGQSKHPLPGFDDLPVYVAATIRSEYLGLCSRFRGLPEALNESQYLIPRLTREQQREVIEGPINMMGASIEPALVQRLLNDLSDDPDQLPALQHALMRTWEQSAAGRAQGKPITIADYEAVGSMADVLNHDAEKLYSLLSTNDVTKEITRRVFQRLVAPDNQSRSPTSFSELVAVTGAAESDVNTVLDVFKERGFLTVSRDQHQIVDITHESLIRSWKTLREWVQEEAESAENFRRLADTAVRYAKGGTLLFVGPELQEMLNWRDETKPNEAWADRYHPRFREAMEFLELSRKQQQRGELKGIRLTGLGVLILLSLAVGTLIFVLFSSVQSFRENDRNRRLVYDANISFASNAVESRQFNVAQNRLDELRDDGLKELRGFEWFYIWRAARANATTSIDHPGPVSSIAFSRDSNTIAVACGNEVKLWHIASGTVTATLTHPDAVSSVVFSPDGKSLATAGNDKIVRLWDATTRRVMATFSHSDSVLSLAFSPDSKILASASRDKTVKLLNTVTYKELATLSGHSSAVTSVTFSPNGQILASASEDQTVKLWDASTHGEMATRSEQSAPVLSVAFSPDFRILASASADGTVVLSSIKIELWSALTIKKLGTISAHSGAVRFVAFSPDGKTLASANDDNTVKLWDTSTLKELTTLSGHAGFVSSIAFSPDGNTLASGSNDKTVKLWLAATSEEVAEQRRHGY